MSQPLVKPRKKPSQPRARATVEAILEATAHILVAEGYEPLTTNKVAKVAGVSIGSLYQYFPNKEALISALVESHIERILAIMASRVQDYVNEPVPVLVRALVGGLIDAHLDQPELHRALREQVPQSPTLCSMHEFADRIMGLVVEILKGRLEQLRPVDPTVASFLLTYAVDGVIYAAVLHRQVEIEREQLVEELSAMVVRYLTDGSTP